MCLLKKSFRNNDLSSCYEAFARHNAPGSSYADSQIERDRPSPTIGEKR
ncbi:hypothetical protein EMIT0P12_70003 [Pseudomonas sp. IT-P12]